MKPTHDDIRFATELRGLYQALEDEHDEEKRPRMFEEIVEHLMSYKEQCHSIAREEERERTEKILQKFEVPMLDDGSYTYDPQCDANQLIGEILQALNQK